MASVTSSVKALNAFLKHSRTSFLKYHATRPSDGAKTRRMLHVVMGNEALDLDSIVSSVLLANLYHHCYMSADSLPDKLAAVDVLPILPIERRDLVLRQEAQALLEQVGVDIPSLLFLDDAVLPASSVKDVLVNCQKAGQLRVTITDHNVLGQEFSYLKDSLVGIVDHHVDPLGEKRPKLAQETQIVVPLGSASTLVAERYLETTALPSIGDSDFEPTSLIDAATANLLIATILIDTANMDPKMERGTKRDENAIAGLIARLDACGDRYGLKTLEERTALFNHLQAIKFDMSRLATPELLRKDYKSWTIDSGLKYGISSVTLSTADWLAKDSDISSSFANYITENNLAFLLVMTSFTTDDRFQRELMALAAPDQEALLEKVLSSVADELTLKKEDLPGASKDSTVKTQFFKQDNIKLSRKQVQPAVHNSLSKL